MSRRASSGTSSVRALLAAVVVRFVSGLLVVSLVAGVLTLLGVSGFGTAWGWGAVVAGALVGVTANDVVTRGSEIDVGTVYGAGLSPGPDRTRGTGEREGLTGFGAFLLVGLPLAAAGLVVLSL